MTQQQELSQREFEALSRRSARSDDAPRLELLDGRAAAKAWPDGNRARIIAWLTQCVLHARPRWWLYPHQGLRVETYRKGNARPDGALAASGNFVGQGEWASTDGVLMVVEVTSGDRDTDLRDRVEKPRAYAEAAIPVYLLIDRDSQEVKVHSEPDGVRYEQVTTVPFGKTVALPAPVGIELDTAPLTDWVR
ncbi:Uma2 family endonuclease [Streptomyces sp. HNM0574]|uniref:Uma2 family endonuclease n=1 Tax=Streptomyces sp. HNM0574 TaxID=2714954 RepID=UPI00146BEAEC|nr:Uma2 family endonuclease [Streptomyces sp. HNM0574]NLU69566.1 Uma2 family endonuclease [Streptomyces sp. HNM0574]